MQQKQGSPSRREPPSEGHCTCAMLRRAARRVTQAYDRALRPAGIKLTQFSVLANVLRADGLSITDLAERLEMDRTTLTRNLQPMQRAGWIERAPGPNKRSRAIRITAAGEAVFEAALPLWQAAERGLRKDLGRDTAADLRRLLAATLEETKP